MNNGELKQRANADRLPLTPRKTYAPPTLTTFGHVAALTQGSSCSAINDGITCPAAGGSGMGMASDRRMKQDIQRVGDHPDGFGLYLFRYKPQFQRELGGDRHFGVMADEVERVRPAAITVRPDGYLAVRYGLLGIHPFAK